MALTYWACGVCAWNALKPCPAHSGFSRPESVQDSNSPSQDERQFASLNPRNCFRCGGYGLISPQEYVTESCPECNGTGREQPLNPDPSKEKIKTLTEELRLVTRKVAEKDREIILLRKKLSDHGIDSTIRVIKPRVPVGAPKIGFRKGYFLWSYELNDWVLVRRCQTTHIQVLYRGVKRSLTRVTLTETPPEEVPPLPGEIEVKILKKSEILPGVVQDVSQIESLKLSDQEMKALKVVSGLPESNSLRDYTLAFGSLDATALEQTMRLGLVEHSNGANLRLTEKGVEVLNEHRNC